MEIAEDILAGVAEEWLEAEDDVLEVPEPPADIPVTNSHEEFVQMSQGDQAEALAASVKRGREVFTGKVASCSKCHGKEGKGDGQTNDYDDWTKDWTVRAGLKPDDDEALIPLIARGALPPKNARPRNFANGVFRGGESAEDLYRRISQGIEGSPMPASTFVPGKYEQEDVWHLINFIRSLEVVNEEPEVIEPVAETA
jgi:mono/diheme cytochrome c family protein